MGKHFIRKSWVFTALALIFLGISAPFFMTITYADDPVPPFVIINKNNPSTLDPVFANEPESLEIIRQVCEGLYIHNFSSSELELIPCLATEKGMWNPHATQLTISLKDDVKFHNGDSFNAFDVKWCFDRLQYFTSGIWIDGEFQKTLTPIASHDLFYFEEMPILNRTEILGEYQIRFHLNFPYVVWETLLSEISCAIHLPDSNYEYNTKFFNQIGVDDTLVGTGPFFLTEFVVDERISFEFNPDYHTDWGVNHIERMTYRISAYYNTRMLGMLHHDFHFVDDITGYVDVYDQQIESDPALEVVCYKTNGFSFIQMSLYTMKDEYRLASTFCWNHTHFSNDYLMSYWRYYDLHNSIPDGIQYHLSNYTREQHCNIRLAQEILLNSTDPEIQANLTASGLDINSTREDWRTAAESTTPVAVFNFSYYRSGDYLSNCLIDYLKDIGIRLNDVCWELDMTSEEFYEEFLPNPDNHKKLAYSWGWWSLHFSDPAKMMHDLYSTNGSNNYFGLKNETWDNKLRATLNSTYLTSPTRRELFEEIQVELLTVHTPCIYILQYGDRFIYNREYLDNESIGDLTNTFSYRYWFNCQFTPPPEIDNTPVEMILILGAAYAVSMVILALISAKLHKRRKNAPTRNVEQREK